jgi:hypothetical protein
MEFKENTIEQILDSEHEAVLASLQRYGLYYESAFACSIFLTQFLKSVDPDRLIFASFLSQIKKHHTLALFSAVRLHKVQSMMNLRQVMEAGACAAYAIVNPDHSHFVDTDEYGILDPSQKLAAKRYKWLKRNYSDGSNAIEDTKKQINATAAHANLISTHNNFRTEYEKGWFSTSFFDIEDQYHVKTDLWMIGHAGLTLMYFFHEINQGRNVIKFVDNFLPVIEKLRADSNALRAEMMATERFKAAMAKEAARNVGKSTV